MNEEHHSDRVLSPPGDVDSAVVAKGVGCCPAAAEKMAQNATRSGEPHRSGCMVCGAELVYYQTDRENFYL